MISKLHYISQELEGKSHEMLIEEACEAGANWIQLRVKNKTPEEVLAIALNVREICTRYKATFILNDHVSIAKVVKADGVHLGKTDMSPIIARKLLGADFIIGGTANTIEDIRALHLLNVDYIGLGPFRYTATKENLSPVLGLDGITKLILMCKQEVIKIPVIAIGGIVEEDLPQLLSTGVYGVAISSAINKSVNKKAVVTSMYSSFQKIFN